METDTIQNGKEGFKKEIPRFLVAGFSAVGIDALIYYLLINSLSHAPAKAISFLSGTVVAYIINKYWTFEKKEKSYTEIASFLLLYGTTLIINVAVNQWVLHISGGYILFAFLCATGTSTVLNFTGQKWWVFRKTLTITK